MGQLNFVSSTAAADTVLLISPSVGAREGGHIFPETNGPDPKLQLPYISWNVASDTACKNVTSTRVHIHYTTCCLHTGIADSYLAHYFDVAPYFSRFIRDNSNLSYFLLVILCGVYFCNTTATE
jgi:hypothetical protein